MCKFNLTIFFSQDICHDIDMEEAENLQKENESTMEDVNLEEISQTNDNTD